MIRMLFRRRREGAPEPAGRSPSEGGDRPAGGSVTGHQRPDRRMSVQRALGPLSGVGFAAGIVALFTPIGGGAGAAAVEALCAVLGVFGLLLTRLLLAAWAWPRRRVALIAL